jgi:hypothetical protein
MNREKIQAVSKYLQAKFPSCEIRDRCHFDRMAQLFRIECKERTYFVLVAREFLDDHTEEEIPQILDRLSLAESLRQIERNHRIIVKYEGLEKERID